MGIPQSRVCYLYVGPVKGNGKDTELTMEVYLCDLNQNCKRRHKLNSFGLHTTLLCDQQL